MQRKDMSLRYEVPRHVIEDRTKWRRCCVEELLAKGDRPDEREYAIVDTWIRIVGERLTSEWVYLLLRLWDFKEDEALMAMDLYDFDESIAGTTALKEAHKPYGRKTGYTATPWSRGEIQKMGEVYMRGGLPAAVEAFPKRTEMSLRNMAVRLGLNPLNKTSFWSKEEISTLREFYSEVGPLGVNDLLARKDYNSVMLKAEQLGLECDDPNTFKRVKWDEKNIAKFIKAWNEDEERGVMEVFHHLTKESVAVRASILGLLRADGRRRGVKGVVK